MVGPEHPADRRYIAVQAGDGDRRRPLPDEARRRLERVRASIEAELGVATAAGDTERARHAAAQLRAVEQALGRHDEQLRHSERPRLNGERHDPSDGPIGESDQGPHRDAHRGRSVDA